MPEIPAEVIKLAAQGDTDAFERILAAYGDFVFNVSLRMLRRREDAQEAAQEAFLTIYKKLCSFQQRSSLKTWIYRITVNTAINYSRRERRHRARAVSYDEESHPVAVPAQLNTEAEYTGRMVDKLLGMLSEEQRACVVLRSIEGLSYEEIAAVLGIEVNAVRSRLKRAREKMLAVKSEVMTDAL